MSQRRGAAAAASQSPHMNSVANGLQSYIAAEVAAQVQDLLNRQPFHPPPRANRTAAIIPEPKWPIAKRRCEAKFIAADGQLGPFLEALLPDTTDYAEQISAQLSGNKLVEFHMAFNYLSKKSFPRDPFKKAVEAALKNIRNRLTRKIYGMIGIKRGCILTRYGDFVSCPFDEQRKKYVPKGPHITPPNGHFCIPFASRHDEFMIIAFDELRSHVIKKIDLKTHNAVILHRGSIKQRRLN